MLSGGMLLAFDIQDLDILTLFKTQKDHDLFYLLILTFIVVFYIYDMYYEPDIVNGMIKHIWMQLYDMIELDYDMMITMIYDLI